MKDPTTISITRKQKNRLAELMNMGETTYYNWDHFIKELVDNFSKRYKLKI